MTLVGLHRWSYMLWMETSEIRIILRVVAWQLLVIGVVWALGQIVVKIRAWFWDIKQSRSRINSLQSEMATLRAEVLRVSSQIQKPEKPSGSTPPPIPTSGTYQIDDRDIRDDWNDDDDKTEHKP